MTPKPAIVATALNTLSPAAAWNSQVLDKARYEQEVLAGTNADKIAAAAVAENNGLWAGHNVLVNGGMEVWQRGVGPVDANPADRALADGWRLSYGSWAQAAGETGWALRCTAAAAPNRPFMGQIVQDWQQFKGQPLALLVRAGMDAGKFVQLVIDDGVAPFSTTAASASSGFQTYTCAGTVSPAATQLVIYVASAFDTTCTLTVDSAMLVVGGVPARYQPEPMARAWARCQARYGTVKFTANWYEVVSGLHEFTVCWPVQLTAAPLVSLALAGTNGVDYANLLSTVVYSVDANGAIVQLQGGIANGNAWARNQRVVYDMGVY